MIIGVGNKCQGLASAVAWNAHFGYLQDDTFHTSPAALSFGHFAAKRSCVVPCSRSIATAPASAQTSEANIFRYRNVSEPCIVEFTLIVQMRAIWTSSFSRCDFFSAISLCLRWREALETRSPQHGEPSVDFT